MAKINLGEDITYRDENIKKEIGSKIKVYRKMKLGLSRDKFIEGITEKYASIENIETGRSYPDIEFMVRLSNKYHQPICSFIDTGFNETDSGELSFLLEDYSDDDKYRILQKLNIEKHHGLREISIEEFVNTDSRDIYPVNMGKLIHNERIKRNITCANLAERIGISGKTLSNIEHGNSTMSMGTLYRLCSELSLPLDYLLVDRLEDKSVAINYLLSDIFRDVNEHERKFLEKYIRLYKEFNNNSGQL